MWLNSAKASQWKNVFLISTWNPPFVRFVLVGVWATLYHIGTPGSQSLSCPWISHTPPHCLIDLVHKSLFLTHKASFRSDSSPRLLSSKQGSRLLPFCGHTIWKKLLPKLPKRELAELTRTLKCCCAEKTRVTLAHRHCSIRLWSFVTRKERKAGHGEHQLSLPQTLWMATAVWIRKTFNVASLGGSKFPCSFPTGDAVFSSGSSWEVILHTKGRTT